MKVFESSLKPTLADLNTVYYAVKGLSLLGVNSVTYNTVIFSVFIMCATKLILERHTWEKVNFKINASLMHKTEFNYYKQKPSKMALLDKSTMTEVKFIVKWT